MSLFPDFYYQCFTYYDYLGLGAGDPKRSFYDVCDEYVDHREEGRSARVVMVDLRVGISEDITKDARRRVAQWINSRRQDWPEWLKDDMQEEKTT